MFGIFQNFNRFHYTLAPSSRNRGMNTVWIEERASVLGLRANTKHDRGKLRIEVELVNAGTIPLEDLRIKLQYNGAEFRLLGKAKQWMSHLLPGDVAEHVFILTPRNTVEGSRLLIRAHARAGSLALQERLDLGWHSVAASSRRHDRRSDQAWAME